MTPPPPVPAPARLAPPAPAPTGPPAGREGREGLEAVGLVVIGRNEGDRLRACLDSVLRDLDPARVVYVDSGSTDGSAALAAARGVRVVHLDPAQGFTAARARNAGAAALREARGAADLVQFVDGDCRVVKGWLAAGAAAMRADPRLAAVAGRRREVAPEASPFNRLADMEWNTPVGDARAVGGDALYRRAAFDAAGGFDADLICGEEPELCFRLRARGWRVERLAVEMTAHDAAMTRVSQWARRTIRGGWAFAEGAHRMGASPERYNRRERDRILFWGAAVPLGVAAAVLAAGALALAGSPLWPWAAAAALLGLAAYPAVMARAASWRRRRFGDPWRHALLYGAAVMGGKPLEMVGLVRFHAAAARGERGRLIEYKGAEGAAGGGAGGPGG